MTCLAAEQQRPGHVENLLVLRAGRRVVFQVVEHASAFRQAGVDVLGVDADLAAVAPADFAGQRLERVDDGTQKRRFALAVVADDRRPRAVIDFQFDVRGDLAFGIADRQIAAAQGRALCAARRSARGCCAVGSSLAISISSRRSSCLLFDAGSVAVLARALFLAMNSSRCRRLASTAALVRSSCSRRSCLIFQKGVDLARETSSACRATSRACGVQVAPRKARSCETIKQASGKLRRKCSSRICVRKSRKFVGSSSSSRLGSCSSRAASFTRVCQPPESLATGPSR